MKTGQAEDEKRSKEDGELEQEAFRSGHRQRSDQQPCDEGRQADHAVWRWNHTAGSCLVKQDSRQEHHEPVWAAIKSAVEYRDGGNG